MSIVLIDRSHGILRSLAERVAGVFVFGCIFFLFTLRAACRRWDVR